MSLSHPSRLPDAAWANRLLWREFYLHKAFALGALAWLASGCATIGPRFSPEIAAAFAHDPMRVLSTSRMELYYPANEKPAALRILARMDDCLQRLYARPGVLPNPPKAVVFLTSADFNNAYVYPQIAGVPEHMVVPHHMTLEIFNWFELGLTDVGDVACHESVHYVQMQQTAGFWNGVNLVLGDIFSPNAMLETWFLEGLATYYEGHLGEPIGRSNSPIWRGMFLAGVASRQGDLEEGDLSPENREMLPFGGNYLVGMHFVEFLARRYGEEKLWQLVREQAYSILSPFFISERFRSVYGKNLDELFEAYRLELRNTVPRRTRPAEQRVLDPNAGYLARVTASKVDGAVAEITAPRDDVQRLVIREKTGRVRLSVPITPVVPIRPYVTADPEQVSGLSFSPDAKWLFMVTSDLAMDGAETSRLLKFDAHTGGLVRRWDLGAALGGSVSPDGTGYLYVSLQSQTANLARLDFASGQSHLVTHFGSGETLAGPEYSPDGKRIVFVRRNPWGFDLALLESDGSITSLTQDEAFDYSPHWVNENELLFLREVDGQLQLHLLDPRTKSRMQLTHVPYLALDPAVGQGTAVFLNRDGWSWSVDEVPLRTGRNETRQPSSALSTPKAMAAELAELGPKLLSDDRYSPLDHLFIPSLRVPFAAPLFYASGTGVGVGFLGGLSLKGADRLGYHNYALNVTYDSLGKATNIDAGYGNNQLAPWYIEVDVGRQTLSGTTQLSGSIFATRPFWTTTFRVGLEADRRSDSTSTGILQTTLVGPSVSVNYFAGQSTPYAGTRLGLGLLLNGAVYSPRLGSSVQMEDVGAQLTGYLPLPLFSRQSLRLFLRGRALPGAPQGLLQVGGLTTGLTAGLPNIPGLGPLSVGGVAFTEYLRGYEDFALRTNAALISGAAYRYPLIIDKGFISTLYVFPSLFLRQIDFEAYAPGAWLSSPSTTHRAAGGAIYLRTLWSSVVPISIYYQYAYRFDDGLGSLHLVGLLFE